MHRWLVGGGCWIALTLALFPDRGISAEPFLVVLGVAQDGGYPQAGCNKECCAPAWKDLARRRYVSCVAVVDPDSEQRFMFDCTPDFRDQLRLLDQLAPRKDGAILDGVLPTHAHVGHYTGLMHFGREVMGTGAIPVFAMPRMKYFLESQGPWSQLVELEQIDVRRIMAGESVALTERLTVTPFLVPHRDEFSETVGFRIEGPERSAMYLPDIDKWDRWNISVESMLASVDYAFLDGTFLSDTELPGRDMSEIPHPFIEESVARFLPLPAAERNKIYFIHFNHSNPVLVEGENASILVDSGMHTAQQGQVLGL